MSRGKIVVQGERLRFAALEPHPSFDGKKAYEDRLEAAQKRILRVQQAYWHSKRRGIIVFQGPDAAGKGGTIRRLTELLDPRGVKVWPIGAPRPDEQGRHYLYRFWQKLPEPGTLAVFDRSWYERVLVERVEGFAGEPAWRRAYDEINEFERLLQDDGVRIVKLFLAITAEEQLRRFAERLTNPAKRWKFTGEDIRNRARWDDYLAAAEEMFDRTSTTSAPWHLIPADHKWHCRVAALETIAATLEEGVNLEPPPLDPELMRLACEAFGLDPRELSRAARAQGKD